MSAHPPGNLHATCSRCISLGLVNVAPFTPSRLGPWFWTFSSVKFSRVGAGFLSFLEAVRRGSGLVDAEYAGWLVPRDRRELAILDTAGVERVRLAGWVRDDLSDHIADVISGSVAPKLRERCAELARYYLRPVSSKQLSVSRATLSNWRRDAAGYLADQMRASHSKSLSLTLRGLPEKDERISLDALARDPATKWLLRLDAQERDVALYRALADAAAEAKARSDARLLIGVALIAARLAPGTNSEPSHDFDGTALRGRDGRKFTRTRLAAPLVLLCLHRAAVLAQVPGQRVDPRAILLTGHRLTASTSGAPAALGPLASFDTEKRFDPELLDQGISHAWSMISSSDARPILAVLTRHAALAAGMVDSRQQQALALLSMAVARRQSDRRALDIDLHHPTFRSDSTESVLFQLRFRRECLMLASHHNPGRDWRRELTGMSDLLVVRRSLLPADEARRMEKVYLHLRQGVHLRQARELTAAGQPMDVVPASLTDDQIRLAVQAVDDLVAALRDSFRVADQDSDGVTLVNAHRRKTEAEGVVHLLSRVRHPDALGNARRLQRDLNRLDEVYFDEHSDLRPDVAVLWLLAMADQCVRRNETEQARHYVTTALHALPEGIPHLAIRAASVAATVGDVELAKQLVQRVPQSHTWPSYVRHLAGRLRTIDGRQQPGR